MGLLLIYGFSYITIWFAMELNKDLKPLMTTGSMNENMSKGIFYNDGGNANLTTPYPGCSMHWGSQLARVRLLDLAAMAYYICPRSKRLSGVVE